jgi:hypothetical protein
MPGIAALIGLQCFAWFCAGEIDRRTSYVFKLFSSENMNTTVHVDETVHYHQ